MNRKPPLALCAIALIWISCNKSSNLFESSLAVGSSPASSQVSTSSQPNAPSLTPAAYVAWADDHAEDRSSEVMSGGFTYQLQYTPHDLIALQRLRNQEINSRSLEEEKKNLGSFQYYTLSICSPDGSDIVKYKAVSDKQKEDRAHYFSYDMQRDISLVDGDDLDTLQCAMYHYEKSYGLSPCTNFLLAFPLRDTSRNHYQQDKTIIYRDKIFGNGLIIVKLKADNLQKIPTLALNPSQK